MNSIFKQNLNLEKLECEEKWDEIIIMLYDNWKKDRMDLDSLLRVGTECWYVLTFWERINSEGLKDWIYYMDILTESKIFGLEKFSEFDNFLWIFGYMMELFPYWFTDFKGQTGKDYDDYQKVGKNMIDRAYQLNPNNHIAKMLLFPYESKEYEEASKIVEPLLDKYFPGNSEIEQYFKRVL